MCVRSKVISFIVTLYALLWSHYNGHNILDKITSQKLYHNGTQYLIWHIMRNFLAFVEILCWLQLYVKY